MTGSSLLVVVVAGVKVVDVAINAAPSVLLLFLQSFDATDDAAAADDDDA